MQRSYWEKIASDYEDEIFDVLRNDKKALISKAIKKHASKNKTVIDIGCAVGKWLPLLSPLFKKVFAVDISQKNLEIAKNNFTHLKNIEYIRADMSGNAARLPKSDLGICINAILTPFQKERTIFFKQLSIFIKKGGWLILTVPSLESAMLTSIISQQWKIDRHLLDKKITTGEAAIKWKNIKQGNKDIDGVPHKHYLKEELQLLLENEGFITKEFQKIEYEWDTEFVKPPKWLKDPKPWDWMVVAKKS